MALRATKADENPRNAASGCDAAVRGFRRCPLGVQSYRVVSLGLILQSEIQVDATSLSRAADSRQSVRSLENAMRRAS
jgi:hypothetical protein